MNIKCILKGHKRYEPNALKVNGFQKDLISLHDDLGEKLFAVNVCDRCGAVYSDLRKNKD